MLREFLTAEGVYQTDTWIYMKKWLSLEVLKIQIRLFYSFYLKKKKKQQQQHCPVQSKKE